ncbi:hypothetical protein BSKO_13732 [Bryopsis sp. KO-2023]|nr:hypothetical protein BSKO_13732 [Bryopsis sp. KO-2023]
MNTTRKCGSMKIKSSCWQMFKVAAGFPFRRGVSGGMADVWKRPPRRKWCFLEYQCLPWGPREADTISEEIACER